MKRFLSIAALGLLLVTGVLSAGTVTAPPAANSATTMPTVYFSDSPDLCLAISGSEYWIFVHSPEDDNFNRITFDLETAGIWAIPPIVISEPGVIVGTANVSTSTWRFDLLWSWRVLDRTPIIKLLFVEEPQWMGTQMPTNVVFERSGGDTVRGHGLRTSGGCCADCFPCSVQLYAEDPAFVVVNRATEIPFEWSWFCYALNGGPLTVSDTEGWVSSWTPAQWISDITCGQCFLERHPGMIVVDVPADVTAGATSQLTIAATMWGSRTITLEAVEPVPVQTSTWGAVKALFD
jgi:hypothetical protein